MAGLYIHIPYCHSKCSYCDFYSRPDDGRMEQVAETIVREYRVRRAELAQPPSTVYIGGGTPSILPAPLLRRIVSRLDLPDSVGEFTIEANPEDISPDNLQLWRDLGINRVSMGVQSLNDIELQAVGRRHSANMALDAINLIQKYFDRVSCDLIYGLPGQTLDSWQLSLDTLLSTGIGHLSAYSLSYEPGTLLYARMIGGKITPVDDDTSAHLYEILTETTAGRGMRHYEISNFAIPGQEAQHNSAYWTFSPYLGLGPSAHSFDGRIRRVNPSSVIEYLSRMPSYSIEEECETDCINDRIITALRTDNGLDLDSFDDSVRSQIKHSAARWISSGMLSLSGSRLLIPERYWLLADAIMRDLIV